MTLFDSNPHYREKATIFRVFALLPLFSSLLSGCVCRWFAVNIPMDLGTNDGFAGDLDIVACLKRWPNDLSPWPNKLAPWPIDTPRSGPFYRTWEVKVAKLGKNGEAHSLKLGKTRKVLNQLEIHRRFGSPNVSLLDVYLCEAGFFGGAENVLPPNSWRPLLEKLAELRSNGYGYQVLRFGHDANADGDDVGLYSSRGSANPYAENDVLFPAVSPPQQPFSRLASRIDSFWESNKTSGPFRQMVVFCRACRSLKVISSRSDDFECPDCHDDLIVQS